MLRLLAMAVLLGGVAVGCAGPRYVALDATGPDAAAPTGTLTLLSSASLALRPAQTATIDLRFTDATGAPGALAPVAVAIEGTALDSTLVALAVTTDAAGLAHAQLVAGTHASRFRVRLSVMGAAPVYVEVGVGTSFGALLVRSPYTGMRAVTRRIVDVVPGSSCDQLLAMPPASGGRTDSSLTADISITALPTTLTYAVLVRAQGAIATEAMGCAGPISPAADVTTRVVVALTDVPLAIDGRYDVHIALDAHGAIRSPVAGWSSSIAAATATRGGDSALLLDGIEAELVRTGATAAATQLHMRRAGGALDSALETQLAADHSAPTTNIAALLAEAASAIDAPTIGVGLVLAVGGSSAATTQSFKCDDGRGGSITLTPPTSVPHTITFTADPAHPMLSFSGAPVDAPIGALALAWVDAIAGARVHVRDALALTQTACASLETFARSSMGSTALSACDATCRGMACSSVLAQMNAARVSSAAALDHRIAGASVSASVVLRDDGDARVNRFDGMLVGDLVDASGARVGAVSGTLAGTRAPP